MSFQWIIIAAVLYIEIGVGILLVLPWIKPAFWRTVFNTRIIRDVLKHGRTIFYSTFVVLVLLFADAARECIKYSNLDEGLLAAQAMPEVNTLKANIDMDSVVHMRLFRAQRNFYVSGFALVMFILNRRILTLILNAQLDQNEQTATQDSNEVKANRPTMTELDNILDKNFTKTFDHLKNQRDEVIADDDALKENNAKLKKRLNNKEMLFNKPIFIQPHLSIYYHFSLPQLIMTEVTDSEGVFDKNTFIRKNGLSWFTTALFIFGDLAGAGLVSLPTAMVSTGLILGTMITFSTAIIFGYTSVILGKSWMILLKHWSQYRSHCRQPYSEMALRAGGIYLQKFTTLLIFITQFGLTVVYLLLASKNVANLIKAFFGINISFCMIILILSICILPLLFLKSPNDFWMAACLAMLSTSIAIILICIASMIDYNYCQQTHETPDFKTSNMLLAIGTVMFAYGGHSSLVTIQHDMMKPQQFTISSLVAFGAMFCFYLPPEILGYITYGDSLRDSIIESIQTVYIQQIVNLCIALHCILAIIISVNPIFQQVEETFNISHNFGLSRILVRSAIFAFCIFVAESIPSFGPLINLVGGCSMTFTSIILPVYIYASLKARDVMIENKKDNQIPTLKEVFKYCPPPTLIICTTLFFIGIIGAFSVTFSAIKQVTTTHFVAPCYLSVFEDSNAVDAVQHTNCCGHYQNVSIYGDSNKYCSLPKLDFY
uniref:Aa_trans domain-containing protein n=1 Tax=Rhabditophanes sp. KR3021 TaxID=114890 RepID=A0AC35TUI4_9BILA